MPLGQANQVAQRAHQETTQHFMILHPLAQPDANANTTVAEVLQEIDNLTTAASSDPVSLSLHLWETWWALLEIVVHVTASLLMTFAGMATVVWARGIAT